MTDSRNKGKRGELEWARYLRDEYGCVDARRGRQFRGTPDSPDVVGGIPGTHAEVKRVERLSVDRAIERAEIDCGDAIPYVAHRRNRKPWLVTIRACDLVDFARAVIETTTPSPSPASSSFLPDRDTIAPATERGISGGAK